MLSVTSQQSIHTKLQTSCVHVHTNVRTYVITVCVLVDTVSSVVQNLEAVDVISVVLVVCTIILIEVQHIAVYSH